MENSGSADKAPKKGRTSIKRTVIMFSAILFTVVLVGGSAAFGFAMWQIVHTSTGNELRKTVETERIKLEASVNGEIAVALKMADSPLIKRHFQNPGDSGLREIAFEEIEGYRRAFSGDTVFWVSDVDREFYFAEDNHYTVNPNDPDSYWYNMTLYQTDKFNFNINYNAEIQKIMLFINAPVFDSRRTPLGLVGTGIDLSHFVDTIYQSYTGDAELYFFNSLGEITGARDVSLITSKTALDAHLGDSGEEILARVKELKPGDTAYFSAPGGEEVALGSVPALEWYIIAIFPITIENTLDNAMTVLFLAMMTIIAVIIIVFLIFIIGILRPLNYIVKMLGQISTDWDLTQRLQFNRKDEIGTLGEYFNLTFERMRNLIFDIKKESATLSEIGSDLAKNMHETAAAVNEITANIRSIKGRAINQSASVTETHATMEQVEVNINKLNGHIESQGADISRASSAIEEMLANIQSVTGTLGRNAANVETLQKSSGMGHSGLLEVAADIKEISRESEGILEINAVMENISSQTNLLSMNAAIEAAHAGEAGKGFAVVAGEIRKLAESSSNQSKTISTVLKKIKESINKITNSTEDVLRKFEAIDSDIRTVAEQENQILNAMEEQGVGSKQILEGVSNMNEVTRQVQNASHEMLDGAKEVIVESGNLEKATLEITTGMNEMTTGAEQIDVAVNHVNEISGKNNNAIATLMKEISRFKVE